MSGNFNPLAAIAALEETANAPGTDADFSGFCNSSGATPQTSFFWEAAPESGRTAVVIPNDGQPGAQPWDAADWEQYFDERVAVAGICGGQAEAAVRAVAWRSCLARWLDLHPATSDPTRCLHCGRADEPGNLVPFGVGPHAWLHSECWRGWYGARMAEAAQALRAIVSGR